MFSSPVSYTHLDVYKRQVETFVKQATVDVAEAVKRMRVFHRLVGSGFVPVSYTHLFPLLYSQHQNYQPD